MVTVYHYLILSAFLFSVGVLGVLARRNAVGILISIELILNAANINFLAFSRYGAKVLGIPTLSTPVALDGHVFAIFVIILAACEAAIATGHHHQYLQLVRIHRSGFREYHARVRWSSHRFGHTSC